LWEWFHFSKRHPADQKDLQRVQTFCGETMIPRKCVECGTMIFEREGFYIDLCERHNRIQAEIFKTMDLSKKPPSKTELAVDQAWEKNRWNM
jgi:uncharacterized Zn finger protein (UPF0148 family)